MSGWTDAEHATLTRLWSTGMSSAAIGREMGKTKNAVVGKRNRLDLAERPSPIAGLNGTPVLAAVSDADLPFILHMRGAGHNAVYIAARLRLSLPSVRAAIAAHRPALAPPPAVRATAAPRVVCVAPKPPEPTRAPIPRRESERRCEWLDGDTKPYVRCTAAHLPGMPYCEAHAARSYVHWPTRRSAPVAYA